MTISGANISLPGGGRQPLEGGAAGGLKPSGHGDSMSLAMFNEKLASGRPSSLIGTAPSGCRSSGLQTEQGGY